MKSVRQIASNSLALGFLVAFSPLLGCSQSGPQGEVATEAQPTSFRRQTPEKLLKAALDRYQNAAAYHDRGSVRLEYRDGDQIVTKTAPIQVWLDHDRLYIAAYDVRIWRDDHALNCWILDPATRNFDSQVVRRPIEPGRPNLQQLLADPILAERLAAGLAGPPPQLEWLFSGEPLQPLFDGSHQFRFGSPKMLDGVSCQRVTVDDEYVFWIDQQNSTIRRIQLPSLQAPINPGEASQAMSLSMEFSDASFRADQQSLEFSPLPAEPKYVTQFVPLPPPAPPAIVGSSVPAFKLQTESNDWALSHQGSDRELTILIAFNGDPPSQFVASTIDQWQARMPADLRQRVRIGLLVAPGSVERIPRDNSIGLLLDSDRTVSQSLTVESGGLAILNQSGVVSWVQPGWTFAGSEPLITLGAVLGDLLEGIDVPTRMWQQWQDQASAYQAAVRNSTGNSTGNSSTGR